ncbi:hypothetical protein TNCV_2838221 [Trichonephila clavipes]|nr:hypothetical protein TNCV_2838221 [Trichonephila clavipes]
MPKTYSSLQTPKPSPRFKPMPYGTALSSDFRSDQNNDFFQFSVQFRFETLPLTRDFFRPANVMSSSLLPLKVRCSKVHPLEKLNGVRSSENGGCSSTVMPLSSKNCFTESVHCAPVRCSHFSLVLDVTDRPERPSSSTASRSSKNRLCHLKV